MPEREGIEQIVEGELTPEQKARQKIDQWFADAGWRVIDRSEYEAGCTAVAVREGLMEGRLEADYLLFINEKAVGVLEAKRVEVDVRSEVVSAQVEEYARRVPPQYQVYQTPLPFLYKSNGKELYFRDFRDPSSEYEQVTKMHNPYSLVKKLGLHKTSFFAGLPTLRERGLRRCQYEAITSLERSFRSGKSRGLIVLATGAGKTFAACLAIYRFLAYTPMKRVLFLVDRNNLARQAETAFAQFRLTENGEPLNTIYPVDRLRGNRDISGSSIVISTIQRLYSYLKDAPIRDVDSADDEVGNVAVDMSGNVKLAPNHFDLIIIDESHRSIFGSWRKVLQYFSSARMIGLTATPTDAALAFFDNNLVINYTLGQSVADGVNVDGLVYRIKTEVTENGGAILEGETTSRETVYTGRTEEVVYSEGSTYTPEELNRSIINPSQIKLILSTYKEKVFTEMYPEREPNLDYIPKTLIFALNEKHASNIVKIAREVFGKEDDPDYVQKITYTAEDSNEMIRRFNNEKSFRIAVTCTLVATGTDVPPLEVVLFMRDVQSQTLYVQMKGRGTRTIDITKLKNVTPNALGKDHFMLVDAVGVTEHGKTMPTGEPNPLPTPVTLKQLLESIAHGYIPDEYIRRLASTLARLFHKAQPDQKEKFENLSGVDMQELSRAFYNALDDDSLPPFVDVDEPNRERKALVAPLANHHEARDYILELNAGCIDTLQPGEDTLIYVGFSNEEAASTTQAFEDYCREHADDIEALRIIYNKTGEPINRSMLKDLEHKLLVENSHFAANMLWNSYSILKPEKVEATNETTKGIISNLIQLVRYAYQYIDKLESAMHNPTRYFNLWIGWMGQVQRNLTDDQKSIMRSILEYIATNGACKVRDIRQDDEAQAIHLISAFNGPDNADAALLSLYNFVFNHKTA